MLRIPRLPINSARSSVTTSLFSPSASPRTSICNDLVAKRVVRSIFIPSSARRAEPAASPSPVSQKTTVPPKSAPNASNVQSTNSFDDQPLDTQADDPSRVDWTRSFHGLSTEPFSKEAADILQAALDPEDIEIKPDGIVYLPEIKYRRILNRAFGPGGWGLAPRGETIVTDKSVTREYALLAHGRLVSIARGEQVYFNKDNIPMASEGCKSNAMMRCCKDLGVASELWDPRFIRKFKAEHTREVFVEHQGTKKRTKIWLRKGDPVTYPYAELKK
ncbi:hypothetical protein A1O3_07084 [Capronia epimyces CBS 606.96]|uniref:Mitochondrial genome maintenance protein MGM101 n=1 Tax=Capronia epimyces CBS 606.96 TaxID=1182542 RepID=W9XTY7_9EURO|nr:uncharacterized protein A1O3_07084 [Capronia epimyces CBS 606.96]EXJ80800.1 hypothetical protein A1O3_07084 [Capronia epimyces CBS 606.96]